MPMHYMVPMFEQVGKNFDLKKFPTSNFRTFFDSIFGRISDVLLKCCKRKKDTQRALKCLLLNIHKNLYIKTILSVSKNI